MLSTQGARREDARCVGPPSSRMRHSFSGSLKRACPMTLGVALALVTSLACVADANAQEMVPTVVLHGFASSSYGRTDFNHYLHGHVGGNYSDVSFSLNASAMVNDRLHITAQTELAEDETGTTQELTFVFAEWRLKEWLRLRIGKVKHPFGISTEVFDVGTLRPFADLPQAVYGPVGIVGEAYRGIGFTGSHELSEGWQLAYDAYAGGMTLEEDGTAELFLHGEPVTEETRIERETTKDLIGGRAVLESPWSGLCFGASIYSGAEVGSNHRLVYGAHIEQTSDRWSIRSELAHETVTKDLDVTGAYAEVAYRLDEHWQVALQADHVKTTLFGIDPSSAPSLLYHREAALGVNYWLGTNLALKLAGHRVDGNQLASPPAEDLAPTVAAGKLRTRTHLITFSAQFTF